jgi:hypothetical protein
MAQVTAPIQIALVWNCAMTLTGPPTRRLSPSVSEPMLAFSTGAGAVSLGAEVTVVGDIYSSWRTE